MSEQTADTGMPKITAAIPDGPGMPPEQDVPRDNDCEVKWTIIGIFVLFLCVHLFIFRGVLTQLPELLAGKAVLNTSELVPFFDPSTQFFDQAGGAFSDLTNAYEFRVRYSVLTTWMRYYLILPFAIVLVPFLGAFTLCLVVSRFLKRLLPSIARMNILRATALTTLLIHLILLPAKITHFYTLILGFDIFVISFVLFLRGLLLEPKRPVLFLFASSIIALINPAVHFLVLYPLSVVFFCAGTGILLLVTGGKSNNRPTVHDMQEGRTPPLKLWKRIALALAFTGIFTILPYGLFVKFYVLSGVGNLADMVPDTVASIRESSLSLLHQISFDINSATDNFLRGTYLPATPQYAKLFYFLIALVPLFIPFSRRTQEARRLRPFLILLYVLMLFSMWCSIGYAKIIFFPTFHVMLAALYRQLYLSPGHLAEAGMQIITQVIHVLRFPDRFQFIFFAAMTLLMPMGILILARECSAYFPQFLRRKHLLRAVLCAVIFFFPLFAHREYRQALLTGDFGGFLRPYDIRPLREIKEALQPLPQGKTIVFPPSEGPWIGKTEDGQEYRFIDKFFIYYLNSPSYHFGLSGDLESKYWFYLIFQSLSKNEHWWVNLFRNLHIRYLVINKELHSPLKSALYLQNISQSIAMQPEAMPQFFRKIKENGSFTLYEFTEPQPTEATPLLLDAGWDAFQCSLERSLSLTQRHRLLATNSPQLRKDSSTLDVVPKDRQKVALDLFAREHADAFFRPDQSSFAFIEDHLPSARYFGTVFPMLNLLTASPYNIFQIMLPGPYDTLTTSFVGLIKPTTIRFPVSVPKNGTYEILLRSVSTQHNLALLIDRGPATSITTTVDTSSYGYIASESAVFGKHSPADTNRISSETLRTLIPRKIMPVSDQFSYLNLGTMDLLEGKHVLFLQKNDGNPLAIEGVLLIPVQKQAANIPLNTPVHYLTTDELHE